MGQAPQLKKNPSFKGTETEPGPITHGEKGPREAAFQEQKEAQCPSEIS